MVSLHSDQSKRSVRGLVESVNNPCRSSLEVVTGLRLAARESRIGGPRREGEDSSSGQEQGEWRFPVSPSLATHQPDAHLRGRLPSDFPQPVSLWLQAPESWAQEGAVWARREQGLPQVPATWASPPAANWSLAGHRSPVTEYISTPPSLNFQMLSKQAILRKLPT